MLKGNKIFKVATLFLIVTTLFFTFYIMIHGLGLQDDLDFGAGAYYYTDIPDFDKYTDKTSLSTALPYWIYLALSIAWGIVVYLLWKWIDKSKK